MGNYTLNLSLFQLIQLEVFLENKVEYLYKHELNADREISILKKIYEINPHTKKKFKNL